jgi:hypothetical protein
MIAHIASFNYKKRMEVCEHTAYIDIGYAQIKSYKVSSNLLAY